MVTEAFLPNVPELFFNFLLYSKCQVFGAILCKVLILGLKPFWSGHGTSFWFLPQESVGFVGYPLGGCLVLLR